MLSITSAALKGFNDRDERADTVALTPLPHSSSSLYSLAEVG